MFSSGRAAKKGEDLETLIMSGGYEVDVGGEGSTFEITCFIIDLSLGKTPDVHKIASILLHQYKTHRVFLCKYF